MGRVPQECQCQDGQISYTNSAGRKRRGHTPLQLPVPDTLHPFPREESQHTARHEQHVQEHKKGLKQRALHTASPSPAAPLGCLSIPCCSSCGCWLISLDECHGHNTVRTADPKMKMDVTPFTGVGIRKKNFDPRRKLPFCITSQRQKLDSINNHSDNKWKVAIFFVLFRWEKFMYLLFDCFKGIFLMKAGMFFGLKCFTEPRSSVPRLGSFWLASHLCISPAAETQPSHQGHWASAGLQAPC